MKGYTKSEIEKLLTRYSTAETEKLENYLVEVFSLLSKRVVDRCVREIDFLEMDKWGEYIPPSDTLLLKRIAIRISQETLSLTSVLAKFIFLHEIGHFIKNHPQAKNWPQRIKQDIEADEFAGIYFPEWKQYFVRDKQNNLRLTKLGNSQIIRKTNRLNAL